MFLRVHFCQPCVTLVLFSQRSELLELKPMALGTKITLTSELCATYSFSLELSLSLTRHSCDVKNIFGCIWDLSEKIMPLNSYRKDFDVLVK